MSFAHNVRTLFCASVLSLSALGAGVAQAADEEAMQLRVGTESAYAPFEFTDNGTLTGFDIDLMNAVGEAMGAEVEWVQMSFDGLIPALLTSQLDMAIASFTVTEERAKRINFSDPYYRSGVTFVIRESDKDKYTNAESLKGQRICAQLGSVSAMKAETFSPGNVATFNDAYASYLELKSGGCEAVLNDRPVNLFFMASKGSDGLVEIDDLMDAEDMAMVVPKNNPELLQKVNAALKTIRDNGTYQKIYDKWFKQAAK